MIIDLKFLEDREACKEGIKLFKSLNIISFNSEDIDKVIVGEYSNFKSWLKYELLREYTYDSNGNLLTYKNSIGNLTEYTYDENGNKLSYKDSNGY